MKFISKCILSILIALLLGAGSALSIIHFPIAFAKPGLKNGAWAANLDVGSSDANMYIRAVVARIGLFALNKKETIYFLATTDDDGEILRSDCTYRIEGKNIDTRWWSITLYGEDHFLISNKENRYAYNMRNVAREGDGRYNIYISASEKEGNWIPSGDSDDFKSQQISIALRCYNPQPIIYEQPEKIELPRIIREGCR